jgi:hypothetical protein
MYGIVACRSLKIKWVFAAITTSTTQATGYEPDARMSYRIRVTSETNRWA